MDTKDNDFKARAEQVKVQMCTDSFFVEKRNIVKLLEPIVATINKMQSDSPELSQCWERYNDNKEHLKQVLQESFKGIKSRTKQTLSQKDFTGNAVEIGPVILKFFEQRWDYLYEDCMLAAYHLDPRNHLPVSPNLPSGSIAKVLVFLKSLLPEEQHRELQDEYRKFRVYEDPLHCEELVWTESEVSSPLSWWKLHCGHLPHLQKVAILLLSLPGSSGAVERSFSMLDFIHSSLRNRLDPAVREKLLYIYFNIRALHRDRLQVVGNEKFYVTKSGRLKVVIPADEISHVHDYGLSELFVPLEEHIIDS